ncbi:MAG: methyltransferase family protein [Desulfomonilia bacterium]
MTNEMTKWGVGPKFSLYSAVYCVFILVLTAQLNPFFRMTFVPYPLLASIGIILILTGIPFYILSLVTVMRAFKAGRLVTGGVYGMCRHPVYAAWVIFFVPGIVFLINSWIGFSAPVVMYLILRTLVKEEDGYLERTFGAEYLAYKGRVPAVLPIGWLR